MDDFIFRFFPNGSEEAKAILNVFNYVHYQ